MTDTDHKSTAGTQQQCEEEEGLGDNVHKSHVLPSRAMQGQAIGQSLDQQADSVSRVATVIQGGDEASLHRNPFTSSRGSSRGSPTRI